MATDRRVLQQIRLLDSLDLGFSYSLLSYHVIDRIFNHGANLISCVSVLVLLNAAKTALGLISSRFPFEAGSNERIVRRQGIVISTMRKIDFTSSIA